MPLQHVQPGDLIRAELMNSLVDAIGDLERRIADLEGRAPGVPGPVVITSILPATPRVGEEMVINGRNFEYSLRAAVVRIGPVIVPAFKTNSSDTRLVFDVPTLPGVVSAPAQLPVRVANFATDATQTVTFLPRTLPFQGSIVIDFLDATPAVVKAGQPLDVRYSLRSTGSPDVTLKLTASTSTGWGGIRILDDETGENLSSFTMPELGTRVVRVRVPVPSGTPHDTPFTLALRSQGGGAGPWTRELPFKVGEAPPEENPNIELDATNLAGGTRSGTNLVIPANKAAVLTLRARFKKTGQYKLTVTLPPSTPWVVDPLTRDFKIDEDDLEGAGEERAATVLFDLDIVAPAAGSAPAQMHLEVVPEDETLGFTTNYRLST